MTEKLKSWLLNDRLFYGFLVVLVAVVSFILGIQAGKAERAHLESPVLTKAEKSSPLATTGVIPPVPVEVGGEGEFVASRSGTRYHLETCPGAKQIKEENKVFFASAAAAEAAGYKRAANCP